MKHVITNIICRCIVLLLAVQTINLSINSLEFYNTPSKAVTDVDDLDYIDSMIEFLVENVMGFSKHTFDDKAYSNDIAKLQQNIVHWDLKWYHYSMPMADLKETQCTNVNIIPTNDKALTFYYQEVRPKPPQFIFA
jgi:hypothetical protein